MSARSGQRPAAGAVVVARRAGTGLRPAPSLQTGWLLRRWLLLPRGVVGPAAAARRAQSRPATTVRPRTRCSGYRPRRRLPGTRRWGNRPGPLRRAAAAGDGGTAHEWQVDRATVRAAASAERRLTAQAGLGQAPRRLRPACPTGCRADSGGVGDGQTVHDQGNSRLSSKSAATEGARCGGTGPRLRRTAQSQQAVAGAIPCCADDLCQPVDHRPGAPVTLICPRSP